MGEAIYSRIKFTFLVGLFFLPMVVTMWNRHLDTRIEQAQYLSPLPFPLAQTDEDDLDTPFEHQVADVSLDY